MDRYELYILIDNLYSDNIEVKGVFNTYEKADKYAHDHDPYYKTFWGWCICGYEDVVLDIKRKDG
jgi:hypothetical protein